VFLLDSDAEPAPGCLEELWRRAEEDPDAAVVSPRVLHADEPERVQYDAGAAHFLGVMCFQNRDRRLEEAAEPDRSVTAAASTALLLRRDRALECGLFDEGMVFCREDLDFCLRIASAGHRIVHAPQAVVLHGRGPARSSGDLRERRTFYQARNRWWVLLKALQWQTLLATLPLQLAYESLALAGSAMRGEARQHLAGLADVACCLPGLLAARRAFQRRRRVPDRALFSAAALDWRQDTMDMFGARLAKPLFDRFCRAWWGMALRLLPQHAA
jgi:GT2 family glycosyltransferase